jgi:hypothetical protein
MHLHGPFQKLEPEQFLRAWAMTSSFYPASIIHTLGLNTESTHTMFVALDTSTFCSVLDAFLYSYVVYVRSSEKHFVILSTAIPGA